jgi:hypothetical protein
MSITRRANPVDETGELALDRPGHSQVEPWRPADVVEVQPERARPRAAQPVDVRYADAPNPRRRFDLLGALSGIVGLAFKLTALLIMVAILWAVVGLIGIGGSLTSGVGARVSSALEQGAAAATAIGQRAADAFDPAHPPRSALTQDVEIDELLRVSVGGDIAGSTTRTVTLASIQRRPDATSSDAALYASLHSELRQPNDTKVMGVTVRSTREPRDDYVYKGETVRIGTKLYKVNWISAERRQIALVAYRDQDHVSSPVKASVEETQARTKLTGAVGMPSPPNPSPCDMRIRRSRGDVGIQGSEVYGAPASP